MLRTLFLSLVATLSAFSCLASDPLSKIMSTDVRRATLKSEGQCERIRLTLKNGSTITAEKVCILHAFSSFCKKNGVTVFTVNNTEKKHSYVVVIKNTKKALVARYTVEEAYSQAKQLYAIKNAKDGLDESIRLYINRTYNGAERQEIEDRAKQKTMIINLDADEFACREQKQE